MLFTLFRMFLYFVQSQSLSDFIAILRSRSLILSSMISQIYGRLRYSDIAFSD